MHVALILAMSAVLVVIDQMLKIWVLSALPGNPSISVIPHLLDLTYVENRGAAFGIFQGRVGILSLLTLAVVIVVTVMLIRGRFPHKLVQVSIGLIIAGGVGNLIDRVSRGFVVDYLDISPLFSFPVFNFADCCVVIGTGLLMFYLLFWEDHQKKKLAAQKTVHEPEQPNEEDHLG